MWTTRLAGRLGAVAGFENREPEVCGGGGLDDICHHKPGVIDLHMVEHAGTATEEYRYEVD